MDGSGSLMEPSLLPRPVLPAVKFVSEGRRVFFYQLIAAFRGWLTDRNLDGKSIFFGDYSMISDDGMSVMSKIADVNVRYCMAGG